MKPQSSPGKDPKSHLEETGFALDPRDKAKAKDEPPERGRQIKGLNGSKVRVGKSRGGGSGWSAK